MHEHIVNSRQTYKRMVKKKKDLKKKKKGEDITRTCNNEFLL